MKTRPHKSSRRVKGSFAPHPLAMAVWAALAGSQALAIPAGPSVVAGQATFQNPSASLQVVTQGSDRTIIDWRSFSIGAGEKVRFDQPSSSAVLLNRVTGYDPSSILGQMQSNGRIFLLNPYGIVFGAGARVDVGGLVASSLSLANADFLASRYSLTSSDPAAPAARGAVSNAGVISAPGGTVVLAAPRVSNSGTIEANSGRIGLAAANKVLVDVEGDGLVFFQASASEAGNRLDQLGRIQADGGTVEMRAAARASFADTVLNLSGVVQAHSLGTRGGQVVIDGGETGITQVSGSIDARGEASGEHGGSVKVLGHEVGLFGAARIDASGDAGGGGVLVGGNFQGHGAEPNAWRSFVDSGTRIAADALNNGNGGQVVVWSDDLTRYRGSLSARGAGPGGAGGSAEVSGKRLLDFNGAVDLAAPHGKTGGLLLDPQNITIITGGTGDLIGTPTDGSATTYAFTEDPALSAQIAPATLAGLAATVTLQATNNITVTNAVNLTTANAGFIAQAGRNIVLNSSITTNGGVIKLTANDPAGGGTALTAGSITGGGALTSRALSGAATAGGAITLSTSAGTGTITVGAIDSRGRSGLAATAGGAGGAVSFTTVNGNITAGAITSVGGDAGVVSTSAPLAGGAGGAVSAQVTGATAARAITLGAVTATGGAGSDATVANADGGNGGAGGNLTVTASAGTFGATLAGGVIKNSGGDGGNALGTGTGGSGGNSGSVAIAARRAVTVGGSIIASGGIGGAGGTAGTPGGGGTITVDAAAGTISLAAALTTSSNLATAVIVRDASTVAINAITTGATGGVVLGQTGQTITGALTQTGIINTGTLTGLTGGAVTLVGLNTITNLGAFTAGAGFTLNDAAGGLNVTGAVASGTGLARITTTGGNLALTTGSVAGTGVALTTTGAHDITLAGNVAGNAGNVTLTSGQAISQSAGVISSTAALSGSAQTSAALNQANTIANLGAFAAHGALTVRDTAGGLNVTGAVTTNDSGLASLSTTGGNLAVTTGSVAGSGVTLTTTGDTSGIALGGTVDGNAGNVTLSSGQAISQSAGAISTSGTLSATAAGAITLNQANTVATLGAVSRGGAFSFNNSGGGLTVAGNITAGTTTNAVSITTSGGALALGASNITASGATGNLTLTGAGVTQSSGTLAVGGTTTVNGGAGAVTLTSATNDFTGAVGVTGGTTQITDANALTLGTHTTDDLTVISSGALNLGSGAVTGALSATSNGGAITQAASPLIVTGATTLAAGAGAITLANGGNDFTTIGVTGSALALADTNALTVSALNIGANGGISVVAGGALTLPLLPIATGSGDLRLSSGAVLTTPGDLSGANISLNGSGGIVIGNNVAATGNLALATSGAGTISQSVPVSAIGTTTITAGSGAVSLTDAGNNFGGAAGITSTGAVQIIDANALTLGGHTSGDLTVISTGALNLGSGTVTGTLSATSNGFAITESGALSVTGAATLDAGAGAITLASANNFASLGVTGAAVSVTESNGVALDAITANSFTLNTSAGNGAVTQNAAATVIGAVAINAGTGAVTLTRGANSFGSIGVTGGAVSLVEANPLALNASSAGSLTINTSASNSDITQNGAAVVTGLANINAGSGAVTLTQTNNFGGAVSLAGGTVQITDANALTLGAHTTGDLTAISHGTLDLGSGTVTGALAATSNGGAITQAAGSLIVTGAATVNAGAGAITLANSGNNFTTIDVTGGALELADTDALTVSALNIGANGSVSVVAGGALTMPLLPIATGSGDLSLRSGDVLTTPGDLSGANISLNGANGVVIGNNVAATGSLALSTSGAGTITQTASVSATGATTITAGNGAVTLTDAGNNFGGTVGITSSGAVQITDTNALTLGAHTTGDLTAISHGTLDLGSGTVTGALAATSNGGAITQAASPLIVTGAATVNAGAGGITLANSGNNFTTMDVTGGALNLADTDALTVSALNIGANGSVSVVAGGALTMPLLPIATGSGNLTLSSGGLLTTPGDLSGANISLSGSGGIAIGNSVAATGTLALTASGAGTITQSAPVSAIGTTTISAGSGAVSLTNPGNDFGAAVGITSSGAVQITDANALTLVAHTSGDMTLTSLGALDLGSGTVSGSLVAGSNGNPITQSGALSISTFGIVDAGSGAITLTNTGNNFSRISLAGGAVSVVDPHALALDSVSATSFALNTSAGNGAVTQNTLATVSGATTINAGTGAVTLTQAGNSFGSIGVTGGAVSVVNDAALTLNAINATSLALNTSSADGDIIQTAAATVSGATTITAGAGAVTLTQPLNNFGGSVSLVSAGAVQLVDTNALTLGAHTSGDLSVVSHGALNLGSGTVTGALAANSNGSAITQSGALAVGGAATITAGAGAVTLTNIGNDFNHIGVSGGAVSLADMNAIALDAVSATSFTLNTSAGDGAVTQNAAATITGTSNINAGSGAVTLAQAGNNFGGTLTLTGGAVQIVNLNALTLGVHNTGDLSATSHGALNLGSGSASGALVATSNGSAITQSGALVVGGAATVDAGAGAVTLTNAGNNFASIGVTGGVVSLVDLNAVVLDALTASSFTLNTSAGNGTVTQTAAASITGISTISAGSGAVALTQAGNDFGNTLNLTGGATQITDVGTLKLGTLATGSLALINTGALNLGSGTVTGTLSATSNGGAITQTGALVVGTAALNAGAGAVTLANANNNFGHFGATGGAVNVVDLNAIVLDAISASSFTLDTHAGNGAVTQTTTANVTGTSTINAGIGAVILTQASNSFGSIGVRGGAVNIFESGALALNAITATSLNLNTSAGNGDITQNAPATVSGATTIASGTGAVTLTQPLNSFASVNVVSGGAVQVTNAGSLTVSAQASSDLTLVSGGVLSPSGALLGANVSLTGAGGVTLSQNVTANGTLTLNTTNSAVTQTGGAIVAVGATTVNAGSGAVSLARPGNNFSSIGVHGGAVSLFDTNALELNAITASSLGVNTAAGNGAITQSAAANVSGATTLNAGSGAVTLTQAGNHFNTLAVTGGAVSLVDADALTISSLVTAPNQAVSVVAGGALTLPGGDINTGSADLTLSTSGPINAAGNLSGHNLSLTGAQGLSIARNVTASGNLSLATTNAAVNQTGGAINVTGTTGVSAGSGAITLAQAGNNFHGSVALAGGAIDVHSSGNLTLSALASGPNQALTLDAGGTLTLPGGSINTGTADLSLSSGSGPLVIAADLAGRNVSLAGGTGVTLGGNVTSSGSQTYATAVLLADSITLNAGASKIDLQSTLGGGGHNLNLASTNPDADAIRTRGAINGVAQLNVNGKATLGANITSSANQTYAGPVALAADVTLNAGAGKIALLNPLDGGGHRLGLSSTNAAADAILVHAGIIDTAQLTATGKSTLGADITTTGAQTYTNTVTLAHDVSFNASALAFGNGMNAGAFNFDFNSDALSFSGPLTGTGSVVLASANPGTSIGIAGAAGTYQIAQSTLDRFTGFGSLIIGRANGSGAINFNNVVLPTDTLVRSTSGTVSFNGTVKSTPGAARDLTVTTGALTTFGGAVGGSAGGADALGALTVSGATQLNAGVVTGGAQDFHGALTLGGNAVLSGSAVAFDSTLAAGANSLGVFADRFTLAGPASGSGTVQLAPQTIGGSIGIAGAAGTLQISQALIDTLAGSSALTLGRGDGSGAIASNALSLPTQLTLLSSSGNVSFAGAIDSASATAKSLTVETAGTTTLASAVGADHALENLSITGASRINGGAVTTHGSQSYGAAATLGADTTLNGATVAFGATLDGAHALSVNAAGATSFGAAVGAATALTRIDTDAAGTTRIGGNLTTTGAQTLRDGVTLTANAVLHASALQLGGTVDGAHALTLDATGLTTLGSAVGAATPLASLAVGGALHLDGSGVTTSGAQSYGGAVTLDHDAKLTASAIDFGAALEGAHNLELHSAGITTLTTDVGASTALTSLAATGGGAVRLLGSAITTSGAQSYSGGLVLSGSTRLTGSALSFGGAVSGAQDLQLRTDTLAIGSSVAGTGEFSIAPLDAARTIGVAGGAGGLQLSRAALDGTSGFSHLTIGRTDGSGAVNAGAWRLHADTTLQSRSGDLNLNGSVDGGFALALNTGATTRIAGPVGATTALRSLSLDNNAAAADWNGTSGERTLFDQADSTGAARVITSGAQTYADPVVAMVPVVFNGGAISAALAGNQFAKAISANADTLQLRSTGPIEIGTLTLAHGGSVETDGVLKLDGALRLAGGTLMLVSNATPTPGDFADPELQGRTLAFGLVPIKEASATITQGAGSTLSSAAGSLLVLRSPKGGSMQLDQPGNTLLGELSAVSGTLGEQGSARFDSAASPTLSFIRIASSELHVAGAPPSDGSQTLQQAGLEADALKLSADVLATGPTGQIRARLPFDNAQGSQTAVPGLTLVLSPTALQTGTGFGTSSPEGWIQVSIGNDKGGYITARPKGEGGVNAFVLLGGALGFKPFYDGSGKLGEIRIFYNGDAPRTPQEAGALTAVLAVIEDARHARFEEAVRTENVSARLRSGVIAEVGAGRPATVGRESIRLPQNCEVKPGSLNCQ